jgi:arylsulfatase A-like enzyme
LLVSFTWLTLLFYRALNSQSDNDTATVMMNNRLWAAGLHFLFGSLVALASLLATKEAVAAEPRRPNFLIILADDLGFSDLGCYGGEIETPNLDALAAGGLRFTNFYNTARCWPTRAALLSGYYAQQVNRDGLPDAERGGNGKRPAWARLLPELLKPHGYRSYHSGKWHVDGGQLEAGFDRSYVVDDHDRHFGPRAHALDGRPLPAAEPDSGYYSSTAIADYAIQFLEQHQSGHKDQPFFAYVAFLAPHFPLHAPAELVEKYRSRYEAGWDAVRDARREGVAKQLGLDATPGELEPEVGPPYDFPKAIKQLGAGEVNRELPWSSLTREQQAFQANKMAIHAAMVHQMDVEVGRIIDQLRASGQLDDTVVLFLSDNGASAEIMIRGDGHDPAAAPGSAETFLSLGPGWSRACNMPMRRHKTWVHEGGISTPLVVHWPKGFKAAGEIRHAIGHVIDIAPTLVKLGGGEWPATHDGKSAPPSPGVDLSTTFAQDEPLNRDPLWWFHEGNKALRAGDWKLVAAKGEPWQLYNVADDRGETNDVAATQPDRVEQLANEWTQLTESIARLRSGDQ